MAVCVCGATIGAPIAKGQGGNRKREAEAREEIARNGSVCDGQCVCAEKNTTNNNHYCGRCHVVRQFFLFFRFFVHSCLPVLSVKRTLVSIFLSLYVGTSIVVPDLS